MKFSSILPRDTLTDESEILTDKNAGSAMKKVQFELFRNFRNFELSFLHLLDSLYFFVQWYPENEKFGDWNNRKIENLPSDDCNSF